MFAQSYDPFGFEHPPSPRPNENRKRQENFRQQRMIKAERRREAELGRIEGMKEKLRREDQQRRMDMWECQPEEEEELLQHRRDVFARRSSSLSSRPQLGEEEELHQHRLELFSRSSSSFPPLFIYASASESQDEIDQDFAVSMPMTTVVKTDPWQPRHKKIQDRRIRYAAGFCTEEQLRDTPRKENHAKKNDQDIVALAPLHIIAVDDVSDDDSEGEGEDDENLDSIWGSRIAAPRRPSTLRHTC